MSYTTPYRAGLCLVKAGVFWNHGPKGLRTSYVEDRDFPFPPVHFFLSLWIFLNSSHKYHHFIFSPSYHHRSGHDQNFTLHNTPLW